MESLLSDLTKFQFPDTNGDVFAGAAVVALAAECVHPDDGCMPIRITCRMIHDILREHTGCCTKRL